MASRLPGLGSHLPVTGAVKYQTPASARGFHGLHAGFPPQLVNAILHDIHILPLGGKGREYQDPRTGGIKFIQQQFPPGAGIAGDFHRAMIPQPVKGDFFLHPARQRKGQIFIQFFRFYLSRLGHRGQGPLVFGGCFAGAAGPSFFCADSPVKHSHEVVAGALAGLMEAIFMRLSFAVKPDPPIPRPALRCMQRGAGAGGAPVFPDWIA